MHQIVYSHEHNDMMADILSYSKCTTVITKNKNKTVIFFRIGYPTTVYFNFQVGTSLAFYFCQTYPWGKSKIPVHAPFPLTPFRLNPPGKKCQSYTVKKTPFLCTYIIFTSVTVLNCTMMHDKFITE